MNWKYAFIGLILLLSGVVIGGGTLWLLTQTGLLSVGPVTETTPTPTQTPEVTPTTETTTPAEEVEEKSTLEQMREALAAKYNKPLNEVNASLNKETGNYAMGGVTFSGEIGGAWWLGYKEEEGWIVVADGNGTVLCADIEPYNFPTSLVPECWDEVTSTLIQR